MTAFIQLALAERQFVGEFEHQFNLNTSTATTTSNESRVPQILAGNLIPEIFGTIFVMIRFYSRGVLLRSWGRDDSMCLISWLCSLANIILICTETRYGLGKHIAYVPESDQGPASQCSFGTLIVYQLALGFAKLSLCFFNMRIFTDRKSRMTMWGTIGFIIMFNLAGQIVSIFQCNPVSGAWDSSIKSTCINTIPCFYAMSICNIIADVWLIAFIVPRVWKLKMGRRQRNAILFIASIGWIVIAAAILRVVRITSILHDSDTTWAAYDSSIWSAVEVGASLFCISSPAIKPFVKQLFPGLLSTYGRGTSGGRTGYNRYGNLSHGTVQNGQYELSSRKGKNVTTTTTTTSKIWRGRDGNDSDEDMLTPNNNNGNIVKNVRVEVKEEEIGSSAARSIDTAEGTTKMASGL